MRQTSFKGFSVLMKENWPTSLFPTSAIQVILCHCTIPDSRYYLHFVFPNRCEVQDTTHIQKCALLLDLYLEVDNEGRIKTKRNGCSKMLKVSLQKCYGRHYELGDWKYHLSNDNGSFDFDVDFTGLDYISNTAVVL